MSTDQAKSNDDLVMKEYEMLWGYYVENIENREKSIDRYFKIVAIPAAIAAAVGMRLRNVDGEIYLSNIEQSYALAFLLLVICLTGLSSFVCQCKEVVHASRYLASIRAIRTYIRASDARHENVVVMDRLFGRSKPGAINRAATWRLMIVVPCNAAIAAGCLEYLLPGRNYAALLASFGVGLLVHWAILLVHYREVRSVTEAVAAILSPGPNGAS